MNDAPLRQSSLARHMDANAVLPKGKTGYTIGRRLQGFMLGHDLSWRLNIAIFACVMVFCALVLGAPLSLPPHHASGRKLQPEEAEMSKERRICSKSNLELYIYNYIY